MSINKIKDNYNNRRAFTTRPDRAIEMGGFEPSATKNGSTFQMASGGTSTDFGDLTNNRSLAGGLTASSTTRALFYGGEVPGANSNEVDSIELTSTGNATDFGDLTVARGYSAQTSNGTRAICAGGVSPVINTIDFASIAQMGNFTDFGDLTVARNAVTGISSPVRGVFAGGTDGTSPSPAFKNDIDYITINSTGNATDFGDLSGTSGYMSATNDSSGKGFFIGGQQTPSATKGDLTTDVITIATTGNASNFGELTQQTKSAASACQGTTGFTMGGYSGPATTNVIQRFVMPSLGNMSDFGDLNRSAYDQKGGCGSHDGIDWGSTAVQRPSVTYMPGSGRALMSGGQTAPADALVSTVEMCTISTAGNLSNFGDLASIASNMPGNAASVTRSIVYSGYSPASPYYNNTIQATTFSSLGKYFDFGDPSQQRYGISLGNMGSPTRGVFMGGYAPGSPYFVNIIDYVTIATIGNGTDFGDLATATNNVATCGSSVRGIGMGGYTGSADNTIQYITIASTGNATDFGDITQATTKGTGASSSTRGIIAGGKDSSRFNVIEYVTIASTGNATDFGDLTQARDGMAGGSNSTRGVFMGGSTPTKVNTVDFITIATTGNATDFGDVSIAKRESAGTCDAHGGLQ